MRARSTVLVLLATLLTTGCVSQIFGGVPVTTKPWETTEPAPPPTDIVLLAHPLDAEIESPNVLESPFYGPARLRIVSGTREVIEPHQLERISLQLENLESPVWFEVYFIGHIQFEESRYAWISDTLYAPRHWKGTLTFDVPIEGYDRVLAAQIWLTTDLELEFTAVGGNTYAFIPPLPENWLCPPGYRDPENRCIPRD